MKTLELIVDLIKGIAWPVVFLITLIVLRKPIAGLIPLISRLKYKGLEIEIRKELEEAEKGSINETAESASKSSDEVEQMRSHLNDIAIKSPQAAIMEGWRRLELAIADVAKRKKLDIESKVYSRPIVLGGFLTGHGLLTDSQYESIQKLRHLRNSVTHNSEIQLTTSDAISYSNAVSNLINSLKRNEG